MKTAILGAGVSGMALARTMIERGFDASNLHLFEASPVVGGLCRSKTVDGFTYDVTGGHILFSKDKEVMQWMKDVAGGDDAFVRRDRNTKIRFEDRWVHYPFENGIGDLPDQANYDCLRGYVQAWHQRKLDGSEAPRDFKSWIQWRFGDGIAAHFMDPYNEKIWKRPLEDITSGWVAGRVPDAPVEDVLRAAIGIRTEGYTHQAIFFYPKAGGFQAITDGMGSTLTPNVRLSTPVTSLQRHGEGWKVNGEDFDRVVNTIPMNELPAIVEDMPADVAECMRGLAFNNITCFLLALDRAEHPNLSWVYLPHHVQGPANRITYMSNYSPGNAPEGKTSFLCEVTCDGGAPFPGKELEEEVVAGMVHAGLVKRDEILFTDRTDTRYAYIVYDHELEERRTRSIAWCEDNALHPLGRFGHYDYFNSDQCVISARKLAGELLERARTG
ncbi:MAG: FAD-dependent oxidoreductase [Planctomycetota bacterium]